MYMYVTMVKWLKHVLFELQGCGFESRQRVKNTVMKYIGKYINLPCEKYLRVLIFYSFYVYMQCKYRVAQLVKWRMLD